MNRQPAKPSSSSVTEQINLASIDLDRKSTTEILHIINAEDKKVAAAVEQEIPRIAEAAEAVSAALAAGGRLFYVGAGTSGRLGIIDAAECPPTFGTDPELVQGVIAGGERAVFRAQEGAEDDPAQAGRDLLARGLTEKDAVVGLSASGHTPYVHGALQAARRIGAAAIAISCNRGSPLSEHADISIEPIVGPEVITGSTRMKAATAEKLRQRGRGRARARSSRRQREVRHRHDGAGRGPARGPTAPDRRQWPAHRRARGRRKEWIGAPRGSHTVSHGLLADPCFAPHSTRGPSATSPSCSSGSP